MCTADCASLAASLTVSSINSQIRSAAVSLRHPTSALAFPVVLATATSLDLMESQAQGAHAFQARMAFLNFTLDQRDT
jgi:hypothetical protein